MMTDPLADLLTRMKNACLAKHGELTLPHSRQKEELIKLLIKNGYAAGYGVTGKLKRQLLIKRPVLSQARRLSKPGSRLYADYKKLPLYFRGRGVTVLSTSIGLMTARDAFKKKLGGELICKVV